MVGNREYYKRREFFNDRLEPVSIVGEFDGWLDSTYGEVELPTGRAWMSSVLSCMAMDYDVALGDWVDEQEGFLEQSEYSVDGPVAYCVDCACGMSCLEGTSFEVSVPCGKCGADDVPVFAWFRYEL